MSGPFADTKTIRAALFDVIDAGCTCDSGEKHPWELDDDLNDPAQTEDVVNERRARFVDAVIDRIADLRSIPGETIKLQDLCERHKKAVLPKPTAQVCVECSAEQKAKGQTG